MPEVKFTILSTRPIEQSSFNQADLNNITIESISFIRTEPIKDSYLKNRITAIANEHAIVIFTSMNAAEGVADFIKGAQPQWKIYCLGTATKKIIQQHFLESNIIGEADNASLLAEEIIRNKEKNLIFFCGDQRREELPDKLAASEIGVEELVVYKTIAISEKVSKDYDGILFFSPSAVNSFFSVNTISNSTVLFAIGTTTSECIRKYSNNKIVESDRPGKQHLVEKSIKYFGTIKYTNEHIKK